MLARLKRGSFSQSSLGNLFHDSDHASRYPCHIRDFLLTFSYIFSAAFYLKADNYMEATSLLRNSQGSHILSQELRRFLFIEQDTTTWQEDDDFVHNQGGLLLVVAPIICSFFLCWNFFISQLTLQAFADILHGRFFTENTGFLLFPHWIIGILIPAFFGFGWFGFPGLFLFLSITVILPYGCRLCGPCSDHQEATTLPNDQNGEETPTSDDVEVGVDPSLLTGDKRKAYLERTLQFSQVLEGSVRETANVEDHSYRASHPKSDIIIPKGADDTSSSRRGVACTICLEPYETHDTVCWSQNPSCHHAFHKDCAMDWLMQNTECPVCRRPYIGAVLQDKT